MKPLSERSKLFRELVRESLETLTEEEFLDSFSKCYVSTVVDTSNSDLHEYSGEILDELYLNYKMSTSKSNAYVIVTTTGTNSKTGRESVCVFPARLGAMGIGHPNPKLPSLEVVFTVKAIGHTRFIDESTGKVSYIDEELFNDGELTNIKVHVMPEKTPDGKVQIEFSSLIDVLHTVTPVIVKG
jgi:hypothetical protein